MSTSANRTALSGCHVISLRPVGAHDAMRRAAAACGARVLALSPLRLRPRDDAATRQRLAQAFDHGDIVIATSPMAVRAAAALQALVARDGLRWIAVGSSTATALRRAGINDVAVPTRMDSEGMLSLPALHAAALTGATVVLLTAPGGRGVLAPALMGRGAAICQVDIYERRQVALSPRQLAALCALKAPMWLALSSTAALDAVLSQVPADALAALRRARVVAASARLADHARAAGWTNPVIASDARPGSLLRAAADATAGVAIDAPRPRPIR